MANVSLFAPFDFRVEQNFGNWLVTEGYDTYIAISSGQYRQGFSGNFTYPTPQTFTGTVSAAHLSENDALVYAISGLSHDLITLGRTVLQGQTQETYAYLLSGNDFINGSSGRDGLIGYAGNDNIQAGGDDDAIVGGAGNDQILGGAGLDSAFYSGKRATYTITGTATWPTVADSTGVDGTDTLTSVERLVFHDSVIALDVGAGGHAGEVYRLYQAAFNRPLTPSEIGYWISVVDKGASLETIAQGFINSNEYASTYGSAKSSHDIVTRYYENILHRAPERAGLDFWAGVLDRGVSQATVLAAIGESQENIDGTAAVIGSGIAYTPWL